MVDVSNGAFESRIGSSVSLRRLSDINLVAKGICPSCIATRSVKTSLKDKKEYSQPASCIRLVKQLNKNLPAIFQLVKKKLEQRH